MNPQSRNPILNGTPDAEATLRLIAELPAPGGLEERIHAALRSAPARSTGRLLAWRTSIGFGNGWMRSAAAAAIAFVIAGGGWGVYSRVQQPGGVVAAPARVAGQISGQISVPGGFGGAGAIRMPQTLNGPVLKHPVETKKAAKSAAAKHVAASTAAAPAVPAAPR